MGKPKMCCGLLEFSSPSSLYLRPPCDTSLSPPSLSPSPPTPVTVPTLPSFEFNSSFELCPSLVKIYVKKESNKHVSDFGFVASRELDVTTVWGSSWFLYEDEPFEMNGMKELVDGDVFVSSYHSDFGGTFRGVVTYVDFVNDLVVIKYKDRDCNGLPAGRLDRLDPNTMYKESYICLDYYSYNDTYIAKTYKFRVVDDQENENCQSHLHSDRGIMSYQGIILNSHLKIVGMKMSSCDLDKQLAHVLPIDRVAKWLCSYTYSQGHSLNDIRDSKERMIVQKHAMIAKVTKKIEVFQICLKEAEKELEKALKEASTSETPPNY
ncbi:hypothetical protein ACHQM5_013878 [Ranunculus cassubicifolius]